MRYENRQAPEGINVTKVNPLAEFIKYFLAVVVIAIALVVFLQLAGSTIAKQIPFKYELKLMESMESMDTSFSSEGASPEMIAYLNSLADRVAASLPVDEGIKVEVHYSEEPVFNAFATIGGNLLFYRGLLKQMPHENALAMVMAHEMAHINHRDPVASLGGGLVSLMAMSMFTGMTGVADRMINQTTMLTGKQFTRKMETAADTAAVGAINAMYGHVNGAGALFEVMGSVQGDSAVVPDWIERFAVTHPLSADRVSAVSSLAEQNDWATSGEITPLPEGFSRWLSNK